MRDYKLTVIDKKIYLTCKTHRITFPDEAIAHKYKIALGLGTHPDPENEPSSYQKLDERTYRPIRPLDSMEEDIEFMGCCHSGCPNCPFS